MDIPTPTVRRLANGAIVTDWPGVRGYTYARSVKSAKKLLSQITPVDDWIKTRPRTHQEIEHTLKVIATLKAIVDGLRPDTIEATVSPRRPPP